MMDAIRNTIDSEAVGVNVLHLNNFTSGEDFVSFEQGRILPLKPGFVFCKVPAENLQSIHLLESHGFRFAEFQITMDYKIRKKFDVSRYPNYYFELVKSQDDLLPALEMAGSIFTHDRFSTDPLLGAKVTGRRYQAYVRKSFAEPDEDVYVMKNKDSGQVVSFGTLRRINDKEVRLLIGGVSNEFKLTGLGTIHDYVGINTYYDAGIRVLHTAVSGINYAIMNLEISHLNFKVTQSFVVLRKRYEGVS